MITNCPICGKEYDDYWGYRTFVGKSGYLYMCEECHRNGISKVDLNLNKHWLKKEKEQARKP